MRVPKKIKDLPWPEPWESETNQGIAVDIAFPVVDHERLLVATFRVNEKRKRYYKMKYTAFRLICSKKQKDLAVMMKGSKTPRSITLKKAMEEWQEGPSYCYPEISRKDEAALAKWLGEKESHNHFLPQLSEWCIDVIFQKTYQRAIAAEEIMDDDWKLCDDAIPAGLADFIRRDIFPNDKILLYKKGNVRGTCFQCGEKVRATTGQRFTQFNGTHCPNCGAKVTAMLEGSSHFYADYVTNVATIQRGTDGKTMFIRLWHIGRDYTAEWRDIPQQLEEIARFALRGKKTAKWVMERKEQCFYGSSRYRMANWDRDRKVSDVPDYEYVFYLPNNWEEQTQGTPLQYCQLENIKEILQSAKCGRNNIIRYLVNWTRYPAFEKLWKAGYTELCIEKTGILNKEYVPLIGWTRGSIKEAVRFPMRYLKIEEPGKWTHWLLQRVTDLEKLRAEGKITEKELQKLARNTFNYKAVAGALGYASLAKIQKYIGKQRRDETLYRDYISDCKELGLNLRDKQVLFPADLWEAHQRTIEMRKYKEVEDFRESFAKQVDKLQKLSFESGDLMIRPADTAQELIKEGETLHHCVGGYAKRMAMGQTAIFLIRRISDPGTPFYTLEWSGETVIQCRTLRNADYKENQEIFDFVQAWKAFMKNKSKKKEKKTA